MGEPVKTTTVRFPPWLHKLIWARAYESGPGVSFNSLVVEACVRRYVEDAAEVIRSAAELSELAAQVSAVEDWLRDKCEARHNDDMADVIQGAWAVIDDLYDAQYARENPPVNRGS